MSTIPGAPTATHTLYREIPFVAIGILLNLAPAAAISALKLPIFIDAVGTILITLSLGLRAGILTGVLSFLIGGLTQNPVMPAFSGTQLAIAVYVHLTARRGWFRSIRTIIPTGIGLGIVAAVGHGKRQLASGPLYEERANFLLLACCSQETRR